ncbi:hypothetical protein Sru01_33820 [Sphaerisporangium rufum]|uniref:Uncharacterized protein n=1 Tax=Sphaerisporangium rufum TaxID=1381558 RepID=A0A919R4Y5_9ACTN|nr:hypothetical protein [Sphaerisporangium rufum]GII78400.1 hypothetical protein Sru01_33820 [Sphaerisporangium rufum]
MISGFTRPAFRRLKAAAVAMLGLPAVLLAAPQPVAAAAATPDCAWGVFASADTLNVYYPDTAAAYWVQPYTVADDLTIKLSGTYPDSRYMSFNVYKEGGGSFSVNGVGSSLPDHLVLPDAGSTNPWREPAEPGGRYTVTVRPDVAPGQANVLPLAPAGTPAGSKGYIVMRVYLPAGGDFSAVELPSIVYERGGVAQPVPPCEGADTAAADRMVTELGLDQVAAREPSTGRFARPSLDEVGVFPNDDAAYLMAAVQPPAGDRVVVVRGKAPSHTPGSHPKPWPAEGTQARYFSLCSNLPLPSRPVVVNELPGGGKDYGCRSDDETALDATGRYTYVIGREAQRPAIGRIAGATFVPFSLENPAMPHRVLLRNMVVDAGFAEAVQRVPEDGNPDSAAAVMGDYYPTAKVCSLSSLAAAGPDGCTAG